MASTVPPGDLGNPTAHCLRARVPTVFRTLIGGAYQTLFQAGRAGEEAAA